MILQVLTDTNRRGAQVFGVDLGDQLVELGLSVKTIALAPGKGSVLDLPVLGRSAKSPRTLAALRHEVRDASVVVAHGSTTLPLCALATAGTQVPFVYRQISDSLFWARGRFRRSRVRAALSRAAKVVALWSGSASTLVDHFGVPRTKINVIPNGVPADQFQRRERDPDLLKKLGLQPSHVTVLYVGALVEEKGVDLAISAVQGSGSTQLLVVGDGPKRAWLESIAASRAPGRVAFTGNVTDVRPFYASSDLVTLPSRGGDSMPAALIEAGMMGIPAVSTPVDAIPEIVINGTTGLLVPTDDIAALTGAINALTSDSARRARFGAAACRHCVERFSIDVVGGAWADLLRALGESYERN